MFFNLQEERCLGPVLLESLRMKHAALLYGPVSQSGSHLYETT